MKNCIIVGAGEFCETSLDITKNDLVIAADGGLKHLDGLGVIPDLLVGDFDSLDFGRRGKIAVEVVRLAKEKDDTDTAAAVKIGLERGCRTFHLCGCGGGRFDHTVANLQLLTFLSKKGAAGFLYGSDFVATAVTDGEIKFGKEKTGFVSVFASDGTAEGVNITGLKYPLTNAQLTCDFPLGVSNEFVGERSVVSVKSGTLLIVYGR